jgi:hypothetical protein
MNKLALTLALSLCAALGAPAAASAETFCVNLPSCIGTDVSTPQQALDIAAFNNQVDTVRIGAKATPYAGGLSYIDPEKVTIIGAGRDQTVIQSTLSDPAIVDGNTTSRVEDLEIRYGNDVQQGFRLGAIAEGVRVRGTGTNGDTSALRLHDGGSFRGGQLISPGWGAETLANSGASISDTVISAVFGLGAPLNGKSVQASRLYIRASRAGISAGSGSIAIANSVITTGTYDQARGMYVLTSGQLSASHVTVVGSGTGAGVSVSAGGGGSAANATIANSIVTGYPTALSRYSETVAANLTLRYSSWGGGPATDNGGPGQLDTAVGNSSAAPQFVAPGALVPNLRLKGGSALIDAADPTDALTEDKDGLARTVDGDGDGGARSDMGAYEYQRTAPAADLMITPAAPVAGQQATFSAAPSKDADHGDELASTFAWKVDGISVGQGVQLPHTFATGGTHTVELTVTDPGGLSDTVAKQLLVTSTAGDPQQPQQPPTGGGTDSVAPLVGALRAGPRRVRFRLSEAARVTVRVKRRGTRRARVIRISGSAGANSARLGRRALRDGRYRLTVVATDAAGNSSARRTLRLRVR